MHRILSIAVLGFVGISSLGAQTDATRLTPAEMAERHRQKRAAIEAEHEKFKAEISAPATPCEPHLPVIQVDVPVETSLGTPAAPLTIDSAYAARFWEAVKTTVQNKRQEGDRFFDQLDGEAGYFIPSDRGWDKHRFVYISKPRFNSPAEAQQWTQWIFQSAVMRANGQITDAGLDKAAKDLARMFVQMKNAGVPFSAVGEVSYTVAATDAQFTQATGSPNVPFRAILYIESAQFFDAANRTAGVQSAPTSSSGALGTAPGELSDRTDLGGVEFGR